MLWLVDGDTVGQRQLFMEQVGGFRQRIPEDFAGGAIDLGQEF